MSPLEAYNTLVDRGDLELAAAIKGLVSLQLVLFPDDAALASYVNECKCLSEDLDLAGGESETMRSASKLLRDHADVFDFVARCSEFGVDPVGHRVADEVEKLGRALADSKFYFNREMGLRLQDHAWQLRG